MPAARHAAYNSTASAALAVPPNCMAPKANRLGPKAVMGAGCHAGEDKKSPFFIGASGAGKTACQTLCIRLSVGYNILKINEKNSPLCHGGESAEDAAQGALPTGRSGRWPELTLHI